MNNNTMIKERITINPLYSFFDNEPFWKAHEGVSLKPSWVPQAKKYSPWSLSFDGSLVDIFGISNVERFKKLFEKATNARGQEKNKIHTIHSSSLMPLLFFQKVTDLNPIYVPLDGKMVGLKRYVPEEENEVEPGTHNNSSVDVALFNDDEKVVVLFESKFSEYLSTGSTEVSLSSYYRKIYQELESTFKTIGIEIENWKSYHTVIRTVKNGTPRYCQGPKQMISHFLGARTEASRKFSGYRVYLGELLFDFNDYVPGAKDCLNTYRDEVYIPLSATLREIANDDFKILPLTTYQELVTYKENQAYYNNLEQDIKIYYRL